MKLFEIRRNLEQEREQLKIAVDNLNKITVKYGISADFVFVPANTQHKMNQVGWDRISSKDKNREGMEFPNAEQVRKLSFYAVMSANSTGIPKLYLVAGKRSSLTKDDLSRAKLQIKEFAPFYSTDYLFLKSNSLALDCGNIDLYYQSEYVDFLGKSLNYISTLPVIW